MTNSVTTSVNGRNRGLHLGLHYFNPTSLDSKLTSKWKLGKNTKCSKGCRLKYKQATTTMDYSFLALQFLLLRCIQGVPYIALQMGNGGSNPSDLKAYGRPRVKWFRHTSRKTPKIFRFMHTSRCMLVWGQYPSIYVNMCYTPEWHLSVRVLISLMSAHKRTLIDWGCPDSLYLGSWWSTFPIYPAGYFAIFPCWVVFATLYVDNSCIIRESPIQQVVNPCIRGFLFYIVANHSLVSLLQTREWFPQH